MPFDHSLRLPAAALLMPLALLSAAHAEVRETSAGEPYTVQGILAADVRSNMNSARTGGYDARTTWTIDWRYSYKRAPGGGCAIAGVTTDLAIVTRLPRLNTQNVALQQSFSTYLARLKLHENGHAANGRTTAGRIDAGIGALPAAATCKELSVIANALGDQLIREGTAADVAYDQRTNHGSTQGALWP